MPRSLDFKKNSKMVTQVMKKTSEDLDNKKRDIPLELIDMNPDNERIFGLEDIDYLAENIGEDGFAGAIEVYALDNGRYEISSGHRRFLAMKSLGKEKIPCIVSENVDDVTKSKRLIKSNILNRKMTPLKWARTLEYYREKVLVDFPTDKNTELGRVFNMSKSTVKRLLALNKLCPALQPFADSENISYLNLYAVAQLSEKEQMEVYEKVKGFNLNPEEGNVFTSASKTMIDQAIASVLGKSTAKPNNPTAAQVSNRVPEEDDNEVDVADIPIIEDEKKSASNFEEAVLSDAPVDTFARDMEDAQAIDNQLTVCINTIRKLLKGNYLLSADVKEDAIAQLSDIIDALKA